MHDRYEPAGTLSGRLNVWLTLQRREDGAEIGRMRNFGFADKRAGARPRFRSCSEGRCTMAALIPGKPLGWFRE